MVVVLVGDLFFLGFFFRAVFKGECESLWRGEHDGEGLAWFGMVLKGFGVQCLQCAKISGEYFIIVHDG